MGHPSEITKALEGLGSSIHEIAGIPQDATPRTRVDMGPTEPQLAKGSDQLGVSEANRAVEEAIAAAAEAANPGKASRAHQAAAAAGSASDPTTDDVADAPPTPGAPPTT